MLTRFKSAYKKAVAARKANFVFDGNEFNTRYAGYLIEHLETLFKTRN